MSIELGVDVLGVASIEVLGVNVGVTLGIRCDSPGRSSDLVVARRDDLVSGLAVLVRLADTDLVAGLVRSGIFAFLDRDCNCDCDFNSDSDSDSDSGYGCNCNYGCNYDFDCDFDCNRNVNTNFCFSGSQLRLQLRLRL